VENRISPWPLSVGASLLVSERKQSILLPSNLASGVAAAAAIVGATLSSDHVRTIFLVSLSPACLVAWVPLSLAFIVCLIRKRERDGGRDLPVSRDIVKDYGCAFLVCRNRRGEKRKFPLASTGQRERCCRRVVWCTAPPALIAFVSARRLRGKDNYRGGKPAQHRRGARCLAMAAAARVNY
jgi:hypothetical protein